MYSNASTNEFYPHQGLNISHLAKEADDVASSIFNKQTIYSRQAHPSSDAAFSIDVENGLMQTMYIVMLFMREISYWFALYPISGNLGVGNDP